MDVELTRHTHTRHSSIDSDSKNLEIMTPKQPASSFDFYWRRWLGKTPYLHSITNANASTSNF